MKIIKSLKEFRQQTENYLLTIGNYDGVHLGHQNMMNMMNSTFKDLKKIVLTYDPHPQIYLQNISHNYLLTLKEEKYDLLKKSGIDYIWELNFSEDLSESSAENFFENYIFKIPRLKALFLGYDFKIGMNKSTQFSEVSAWAKNRKIDAVQGKVFQVNGETVSSSLIRKSIDEHNMPKVTLLLGHPHFAKGQVIHGKGRGKTIGIPTTNLAFSQIKKLPPGGVYFSQVIIDGKKYNSVTNLGINPTFSENDMKIETHILDFDQDIYGEEIQVNFLCYTREEKKFDSVSNLVKQINLDIQRAREYFEKN